MLIFFFFKYNFSVVTCYCYGTRFFSFVGMSRVIFKEIYLFIFKIGNIYRKKEKRDEEK